MYVQAWHGVTICCVPITRNHPRLSSRPDLLSPSPTLAPSTTRERRARSLSGASAPQLSLALEQVSFFVLWSRFPSLFFVLEQVSFFVPPSLWSVFSSTRHAGTTLCTVRGWGRNLERDESLPPKKNGSDGKKKKRKGSHLKQKWIQRWKKSGSQLKQKWLQRKTKADSPLRKQAST